MVQNLDKIELKDGFEYNKRWIKCVGGDNCVRNEKNRGKGATSSMITKQRPSVGGGEKCQDRGRVEEEEKRRGFGRIRRDQDATMFCLYLFGPLLLKHRKKRGRERKKSQRVKEGESESKQERKQE